MNVWEGVGMHEEARRFCELWGVDGTVLIDDDAAVAAMLGVRGVPTNIFVDADGTVMAVGGTTPEDLEALTRQLLGPDAEIAPKESREWHWDQDPEHITEHIHGYEAKADDATSEDL